MVDYGFADLCSDPDRFIDVDGDPTAAAQNKMGGTTYHDASVYWKAPWNAKVTVGVNNIFEKEPPRSNSTFANSFDPQYEVPGQFFYIQYNQKF